MIVTTRPGMVMQAEQFDGTEAQAKDLADRFHVLVGRNYESAVSLDFDDKPYPTFTGRLLVRSGDGDRFAGKGDWIAQGYAEPVWVIPEHFFAKFFAEHA